MKMADILRDLADRLAHIESGDSDNENMGKEASDFQHEVGEVDHKDGSDGHTMVPPLQQKLELMKKATGVPNMFDNEHDELDDIKKLTGIPSVMIQMDDSDLDGQ